VPVALAGNNNEKAFVLAVKLFENIEDIDIRAADRGPGKGIIENSYTHNGFYDRI